MERNPVTFKHVAAALRRQWTAKPWKPGRPIASHAQLQSRFNTTRTTVQRAMDLLAEQGFVESRPKVGRFLADKPPHLFRFALVFPGHPEQIKSWHWNRLALAQYLSAEQINREGRYELVPYFDFSDERGSVGLQQLVADVEDQCVAGIVFAYSPHEHKTHPLLAEPKVPICYPSGAITPGSIVVRAEDHTPLTRMTDFAKSQGRRNAAVMTISKYDPDVLAEDLCSRGLYSDPLWVQFADAFRPDWVRHGVRTLLNISGRKKPDVLILTDDHLLESATRALRDLGVAVPDDLLVVSHWNFPVGWDLATPATLIGHDNADVLRVSVEQLAAINRGETVSEVVTVPMMTEKQYRANRTAAGDNGKALKLETASEASARISRQAVRKLAHAIA